MSESLTLKEVLAAVDTDQRELWSLLDAQQQKALKKDFWNLTRYISSVKSPSREVQEHFVLLVNEFYNKHWNDLKDHPELQWKLLCMCSYETKKVMWHEWIKLVRKAEGSSKKARFLMQIYPNMKIEEIEMLAKMTSDKEIKDLAKDHGLDDKQIKELL